MDRYQTLLAMHIRNMRSHIAGVCCAANQSPFRSNHTCVILSIRLLAEAQEDDEERITDLSEDIEVDEDEMLHWKRGYYQEKMQVDIWEQDGAAYQTRLAHVLSLCLPLIWIWLGEPVLCSII
jgi:hypothetical protein